VDAILGRLVLILGVEFRSDDLAELLGDDDAFAVLAFQLRPTEDREAEVVGGVHLVEGERRSQAGASKPLEELGLVEDRLDVLVQGVVGGGTVGCPPVDDDIRRLLTEGRAFAEDAFASEFVTEELRAFRTLRVRENPEFIQSFHSPSLLR
jgi:hypothetical protein